MTVTATELKTNLGRYLELATIQDIFITKNGKNIARLTSPSIDKLSLLDSLVGIIPSQETIDEETIREERLARQRNESSSFQTRYLCRCTRNGYTNSPYAYHARLRGCGSRRRGRAKSCRLYFDSQYKRFYRGCCSCNYANRLFKTALNILFLPQPPKHRLFHRLKDILIPGTPAQMPGHFLADFLI